MRPLAVLLITAGVLGGLRVYLDASEQAIRQDREAYQVSSATGEFSVELTLTFDAGRDEFSLDAPADAPSVLLQLQGKDILRVSDYVSADSALEVSPVDGINAGSNDFFLQVSPADPDSFAARAARIRVFRDGNPIADESIWAPAGGHVRGTVSVQVSPGTASAGQSLTEQSNDHASD